MLWLKLPALGTLVLRLRHRRGRRLLLQLQLLLYQGVLLLPAVPYAVHLDLLPPAVVAAERRVPSAPSESDRGGIHTYARTQAFVNTNRLLHRRNIVQYTQTRPVHEDVAAERLAAEGALVQEAVGLLRLRVGDAERGRRPPRRGGAPAVLRLRAVGGAARPVGLRAAAVAGDHRREVGVAEGVEVGRRELHRPPGVVPGTYGTRAGAGPGGAVAPQTEAQDGSWAWRERRGGGARFLNQGLKKATVWRLINKLVSGFLLCRG